MSKAKPQGPDSPYWKSILVTCQQCGKEYYVRPSGTKRGRGKYCSHTCFHKARKGMLAGRDNPNWKPKVKKICQVCGKEYEIIPSWANDSKYCSRACHHEAMTQVTGKDHPLWKPKVIKLCEWCSKEFEIKPSEATRRHFCSRQCMGAYSASRYPRVTRIERAIESLLLELALSFYAQKAMGPFVCDFVLKGHRLAIECDGDYWHSLSKIKERDTRKDHWLQTHGYKILRLTETEIHDDIEGCETKILSAISPS